MKNIVEELLEVVGSDHESLEEFFAQVTGRDLAMVKIGKLLASTNWKVADSLPTASNSDEAAKIARPYYKNLAGDEEIVILLLNSSNELIEVFQCSYGGCPSEASLDTRKLMKRALLSNAVRVIITHNHPSGILRASTADVKMSEKLGELLQSIHIDLLDSLILTEEGVARVE